MRPYLNRENMSKLFRLAYVSTASKLFSSAELWEMLKESNARNKEAGVTGMLLYKDGQFMPVLEGTAAAAGIRGIMASWFSSRERCRNAGFPSGQWRSGI